MKKKSIIFSLIKLLSVFTLLQAQNIPVRWDNGVNVIVSRDQTSITKNTNTKQWNTWARSLNKFDDNKKAFLYYKADVRSRGNKGLIVALGPLERNYTLATVAFGFKVTNNRIWWIKNGNNIGFYTRVGQGEEKLEIRRFVNSNGVWKVLFKINGTNVYTTNGTSDLYYAYGLIRRNNATIENVEAKLFQEEKTVENCALDEKALINLNLNGGIPPYTISWSNGATSENITNLAAGLYTVDVTDAGGFNVSKNIRVFSTLAWTNEVNVTTSNSSIHKPFRAGIASGASENTFAPGVLNFVEFKIEGTATKSIGFSGISGTTPEYGFLFTPTNYYILDGNTVQIIPSPPPISSNTKFRILRLVNGNVRYEVDGATVYTSIPTNTTVNYQLKATINEVNNGFVEMKSSICNKKERAETINVATLKKKIDGSYHLTTNCNLYFQYREEYINRELTYNIYKDPTYTLVKTQNDFPVPVVYGNNPQLVINFGVNGLCLGGGLYILEVIDAKGGKTFLRLKVTSGNCNPCLIVGPK